MELPLDDDLGQIDGQLPLLDGGVGCQPEALDGGDHVLHQMLAYRVVDSVVTTQQLTGRGRGKEVGLIIQYGRNDDEPFQVVRIFKSEGQFVIGKTEPKCGVFCKVSEK